MLFAWELVVSGMWRGSSGDPPPGFTWGSRILILGGWAGGCSPAWFPAFEQVFSLLKLQ